eukprot:965127-Lingulodinium_polyedra.AAC.1
MECACGVAVRQQRVQQRGGASASDPPWLQPPRVFRRAPPGCVGAGPSLGLQCCSCDISFAPAFGPGVCRLFDRASGAFEGTTLAVLAPLRPP